MGGEGRTQGERGKGGDPPLTWGALFQGANNGNKVLDGKDQLNVPRKIFSCKVLSSCPVAFDGPYSHSCG